MAESKFKIGDRVIGVDGCTKGRLARVTRLTDESEYGVHFIREDDGHTCWEPNASFELATTSLDNLSIDDVVVDDCGNELTVASVHDRVIDLEDSDGHFDRTLTVKEMKDRDFTVKGEEPEVTELTLQQIADKLSMPVEQLKIKESE